MKKQILFALMGMVVMASCNNSPKTTDASGDEAFQKLHWACMNLMAK